MIEGIVVACFSALLGSIGYLFVNWMKDVDKELDRSHERDEKYQELLKKLSDESVPVSDCYNRFQRVREAVSRDRARLERLEEKVGLRSPHPKKNNDLVSDNNDRANTDRADAEEWDSHDQR